jgi:hypothetical protein
MVKSKDILFEASNAVETVYLLIKRRNSEYTGPAGNSAEVERAISFLRSQHEETYKQIISPVISSFLTMLVAENDKKPLQKQLGAFNAQNPPEVSIADYLARIVKYTPCSAECYLLSLIFIDRIAQSQHVRINSYNVHRILLITLLISAKLLDDTTVNNKYYSHVGGISIKELNNLECKLLVLLNYDLYVSEYTFELYRYELELQLIRQMCVDADEDFSIEDILKWEDNKAFPTADAFEYLRPKRIRRSRSFNSPNSLESHNSFNKRKNRSISFTILGLIPPSTTTTAT